MYLLSNGIFRCSGCVGDIEIKADGYDQKVAETAYWDTMNVQLVDPHTVLIIAKKGGKTTYTEVDAIGPDGNTMTQLVKDTTEAETVTLETRSKRVENGPAGSHAVSGFWRAYKTSRSKNGSSVSYKCTAEAFSAKTPLGEGFTAKFDGKYYPVEDDPGHTMVSANLLSKDTVELTSKRNGKIVSISHMTVRPDGKSIHVVFENKDADATSTFDFEKQP
jgi:hypothetical protein